MATEHFYPDWIQEAFHKNWFIYNPETKNYKYTNPTKPNKNYKFLFDPKVDGVKRGDLICFTKNGVKSRGYRNEGVWMWNGEKMVNLCTEVDDYGSVPPEFTVGKEFLPSYWITKIHHNSIVWLDHDLYEKIEFVYIKEKIIGTISEYDYKILVENNVNYIPSYLIFDNVKKHSLTVNNDTIQFILKDKYKLYEKIFNISFIEENTMNMSEFIDYIQNNSIFINSDNKILSYDDIKYYINYNDTKYYINMTFVKKDNATIVNEIKEWLINKKPSFEYVGDNEFFLNI